MSPAPRGSRAGTLVISRSPVGESMSGGAIRAVELARAIAADTAGPVTLAAPASTLQGVPGVGGVEYQLADPAALRPLIATSLAVLTQPHDLEVQSWLRRSGAVVIVDLYDPEPFEVLESFAALGGPTRRRLAVALTTDRIVAAVRDSDHAVCASETQRSLWLGVMLAANLISPGAYDADPALRARLDLVPFGLPATAPAAHEDPAALAMLPTDAEIVLWNGGIWPWLDIETPIRAMSAVCQRRPNAHLVILGASDEGPGAGGTRRARELVAELALDERVHLRGWVPYARRADWLLRAAAAVACHTDHLETRFAYRTRLLDCVWAGLPIVCTEGDELADRVDREGLGRTVPEASVPALADALVDVLQRGRAHYAAPLAAFAQGARWSTVAGPLVRWIRAAEDGAAPAPRSSAPLGPDGLRRSAWHVGLHASRRLGRTIWRGT